MAERTAEQVRAALKNQLIVFDPTFEDPNEQFRQIVGGALGSRRMTRDEVAQAAGIPVEQLIRLEPGLDLGLNERTDLYQQYITPGRGTGFFASLLGGVGDVVGGLTSAVVDPVANALNVHPDAIKAAAALAGMYYGGGGLFFDATTGAAVPEATAVELIGPQLSANAGAGLIDASLGQAYSNLGVGAAAPAAGAGVLTQPIATSPLATMGAPTPMLAADLAAYNALAPGIEAADVAGTAINNMLTPSATTGAITGAGTPLTGYGGLDNFVDPFNPPLNYTSSFAPPTAGVGGVPASAAGTAVPGLNFEQIAAESLGANVPGVAEGVSGSSVFTPATAATTAVTNALTPTLNHEQIAAESLGANVAGAATGVSGASTFLPGTTGLTLDALSKFAKDYGVPLSALISGITGSQAAQSAADTQAQSAREARDLAKQIYEKQVSLQEPFRTAGITAQNQLLTLLGLPGGTQGAEYGKYARPFGMQDFQADPGYAFRLSEGMKALEASRAAKSGLLSGSAMRAATRYGQEMGLQEYGNSFNRAQIERANRLTPLGSLAGMGQAAAAGQAGYAGQYGQTAGALTTDIGAARAAGDVGAANAVTNALGQYARYASNQNLANQIRQSLYGAAIPG